VAEKREEEDAGRIAAAAAVEAAEWPERDAAGGGARRPRTRWRGRVRGQGGGARQWGCDGPETKQCSS
jgi:hypothetical protein